MKIISFRHMNLLPALVLGCGLTSIGCNDAPTTAVVQNAFAPATTGSPTVVFKAWWVTTLFPESVSPGETSESQRTIPATDFAYALLAPDWAADSGDSPSRLVAIKSKEKLTASSHDLLTIVVSDEPFAGDCAAGGTLDAEDARLIVERIFPGEFVGMTYDPATCVSTPVSPDGGASNDTGQTPDAGQSSDAAAD